MADEKKSQKLNTTNGSEDGISRKDARVNADLVVLEPQDDNPARYNGNGHANGSSGGSEKDSDEGNLALLNHLQLVELRKQLEETTKVQIDKDGETIEHIEHETQKAAESFAAAFTANITNLSKLQDFFGKKTVKTEEKAHKIVQKQLGLVKGPQV
jgi:hypothetical protein